MPDVLKDLASLTVCGYPWAEERAKFALEIVQENKNGKITNSEAQELLWDLIATDKLKAVADNIEIKSALVTAIGIVAKFGAP